MAQATGPLQARAIASFLPRCHDPCRSASGHGPTLNSPVSLTNFCQRRVSPHIVLQKRTSKAPKSGHGCNHRCKVVAEALNPLLEGVVNTRIPRRDGSEVLAHVAWPKGKKTGVENADLPVVIVIHEFYGLHPDICGKAAALAHELKCLAIAPDTYRGDCTRFIPKAIYLALSTPDDRVYEDLDDVIAWAAGQPGIDSSRLAVIGFCYGGGKAIRYSAHRKTVQATAVFYGRPLLEVDSLAEIRGRVLGIFGDRDAQFPVKQVRAFDEALEKAGVPHKVSIYEGQSHAFFTNMEQVQQGDGPQRQAWDELTAFLKEALIEGTPSS